MATITKRTYAVKKLPNTDYLVKKTEKFFSSKVTYDHEWYINNQWKGMGYHNPKEEELNINFVWFLNERIFHSASTIKSVLSAPHMLEVLSYLYHLSPSFIMPGFSFTLRDVWGTSNCKYQGLIIESVSIKLGDYPFLEIIPTNATSTFNRYRVGITSEERECLIDFIRLSYLVELPRLIRKTAFFLNNNLSILDEAKALGYCN